MTSISRPIRRSRSMMTDIAEMIIWGKNPIESDESL
jgi:hypothetical protein